MKTKVFHSYPSWILSGVNTWSVNLATAGQNDPEFEHIMLVTGVPSSPLSALDEIGVPYVHLRVPPARKRRDEWAALKNFLEANAPCLYLPNFDFCRAAAACTLADSIRICAVVHSDEECYYEHLERIGQCCDAVVAVSSCVEQKLRSRLPALRARTKFIPYGVSSPSCARKARDNGGVLRLVYANRIAQYQKRVFDLPEVCRELRRLNADFHLTVAGEGPDAEELKTRFQQAGVEDRVEMIGRISSEQVRLLLLGSDAFLLTSDFEGLPLSLLEAMSAGCVPVVYDIESGVRDAIESEVNGVLVPHGDVAAMARQLNDLHCKNDRLQAFSKAGMVAHAERFSLERMVASYHALFRGLLSDSADRPFRDGKIKRPRDLKLYYRLLRRVGLVRR